MIRGLGCLLILSGGVGAEVLHARASRRLLETLEGFSGLFERMENEIRMNRTPLVQLMKRLLPGARREVRQFLEAAVQAAEQGISLPGAWRRESARLTVDAHTRALIREVGDKLCGDEEGACRALRLASSWRSVRRRCAGNAETKSGGLPFFMSARRRFWSFYCCKEGERGI